MADIPSIPRTITVHLGSPDSNAQNVTVSFPDYIKNVASSEIYPTWPENALRANIYAITTFALNRIYTEFYRSKGYNFDITNSTQYDQSYVKGRDIFSNISELVDELFNDYVVKAGTISPYFTQYCSGRGVNCKGLKQWGTVDLARQGYLPYDILRYYYGNVNLVKNAPIKTNVPSYPGRALRQGDRGEDVRTIQRELNRIAANYPAIPTVPVDLGVFDAATERAVKAFQRIFNLTPDGIVGKNTWYRLKYIYNSVKGLSELYSEGITYSETERRFSRVLQQGSSGSEVRTLQYYLNFIAFFNDSLNEIDADGVFGPATKRAVTAFQRYYGLAQDGIVGRDTWNKIQTVYQSIINNLPKEYRSYSSLLYPGSVLSVGSKGRSVEQIQTYLRVIGQNNRSVPVINVDGDFGNATRNAVIAVQRLYGIEQTGVVGPLTWNAIVELYNGYRG